LVRETEFCGLRPAGDFRRRTRENGRNSVRRPRCARRRRLQDSEERFAKVSGGLSFGLNGRVTPASPCWATALKTAPTPPSKRKWIVVGPTPSALASLRRLNPFAPTLSPVRVATLTSTGWITSLKVATNRRAAYPARRRVLPG